MGLKKLWSLVVVGLLLAGCDQSNPKICSTLVPLYPSQKVAGTWTNADDCLHRWGYRLAGAPEPAATAAEAALGACYDAVEAWATRIVGTEDRLPDYRDPITGRLVDFRANLFQEARSYALFYVVQARAGKCKVP